MPPNCILKHGKLYDIFNNKKCTNYKKNLLITELNISDILDFFLLLFFFLETGFYSVAQAGRLVYNSWQSSSLSLSSAGIISISNHT